MRYDVSKLPLFTGIPLFEETDVLSIIVVKMEKGPDMILVNLREGEPERYRAERGTGVSLASKNSRIPYEVVDHTKGASYP